MRSDSFIRGNNRLGVGLHGASYEVRRDMFFATQWRRCRKISTKLGEIPKNAHGRNCYVISYVVIFVEIGSECIIFRSEYFKICGRCRKKAHDENYSPGNFLRIAFI